MKKQTGIWIDSSKAIVVNLTAEGHKTFEIESGIENRIHHEKEGDKGSFLGSQSINNEKKFDERKKNQFNDFIKDVYTNIKDSDELYIFGPAETKTKLEQKILNEKSLSSEKLKHVETSDSMTLNQVVSKVKNFYNHLD